MKTKFLLLISILFIGYGIFAQEKTPPTEVIQGTFIGKTIPLRDFPTLQEQEYKVNEIKIIEQNQKAPEKCSTKLVSNYEIYIPLADLINIEQETARVNKEIIKITKDIEFLNQKLNNPNFINKAPKELVDKQLDKKSELEKNLDKLNNHLNDIKNL